MANGNYDKTNSGALFKNDKKGNEKRPDYKGMINFEGKDYQIAGWFREPKSGGDEFLSLKVDVPQQQSSGSKQQPSMGEDVPF